jgi:hypothetical protein
MEPYGLEQITGPAIPKMNTLVPDMIESGGRRFHNVNRIAS